MNQSKLKTQPHTLIFIALHSNNGNKPPTPTLWRNFDPSRHQFESPSAYPRQQNSNADWASTSWDPIAIYIYLYVCITYVYMWAPVDCHSKCGRCTASDVFSQLMDDVLIHRNCFCQLSKLKTQVHRVSSICVHMRRWRVNRFPFSRIFSENKCSKQYAYRLFRFRFTVPRMSGIFQ